MKKISDDLQPEYNFSQLTGGKRGKYAKRYKNGTNIVHLDKDVAEFFDSEQSVNQALRSLIHIAKKQVVSAK
ncbi:hypothetical protein JW948_15635 [bacterium]|nr:hypothetical protein [bacterium]